MAAPASGGRAHDEPNLVTVVENVIDREILQAHYAFVAGDNAWQQRVCPADADAVA